MDKPEKLNDCINEENDDDENVVTMVDVLEDVNKLEEDAFAVLGAADDVNCTYNQGYMKRQALYACKTCSNDNDNQAAGICLACSYHCHEGHDLIELYTKRDFRCDCGNSLFGNKKCNLQPDKDDLNKNNNYNQNFKGVYCTCARPYPDPEDDIFDEMIQCIVCEDWYHTRHLKTPSVPSLDDYSEMICQFCTEKLSSILLYYKGFSVTKIDSSSDSKEIICNGEVSKTTDNISTSIVNVDDTSVSNKNSVDEEIISNNHSSSSLNVSSSNSLATENVKHTADVTSDSDIQECKIKTLKKLVSYFVGASFWREDFRKLLCKCQSCTAVYKEHKVQFLVDLLDTVKAYEEEGVSRRNKNRNSTDSGSGYEQGLKALSSLGRVEQVEAIHRYNEMQEQLKAYLAKFVENKKVVRAEDIKEFFGEMESRKKQKVDVVPYYCR